jgi:hypothetical protein
VARCRAAGSAAETTRTRGCLFGIRDSGYSRGLVYEWAASRGVAASSLAGRRKIGQGGTWPSYLRSSNTFSFAYYKEARDLIDEGQFGAAQIFSPFNYARGNQYGVEVTANYAAGGFSVYANFGFERGTGKKIFSAQFLFSPGELAFIANHFVFLDHDQRRGQSAYENLSQLLVHCHASSTRSVSNFTLRLSNCITHSWMGGD